MSQSLPHDGHKRNRKQVAPKIKRYMYIRVYIAAPGLTQLPRWQRVTQSAQFMQHASFCACRFPFVLGVKRFLNLIILASLQDVYKQLNL